MVINMNIKGKKEIFFLGVVGESSLRSFETMRLPLLYLPFQSSPQVTKLRKTKQYWANPL